MKNILLIRHGQSEWNKLNLFTGFKNIELSSQGVEEANKAGQNFKGMTAARRNNAAHPFEQVGERLRAMMPWIAEEKIVDQSKN